MKNTSPRFQASALALRFRLRAMALCYVLFGSLSALLMAPLASASPSCIDAFTPISLAPSPTAFVKYSAHLELTSHSIQGKPLVDMSPDGRILAVSEKGNDLKIVDAKTGQIFYNHHLEDIKAIQYSRDGQHIFVVYNTNLISILNGAGQLLHPFAPSGKWGPSIGTAVAISPDRSRLFVPWENEVAQVWDLTPGKPRFAFDLWDHRNIDDSVDLATRFAAYNSDGSVLMTVVSKINEVRVWRATNGSLMTARRFSHGIQSAQFCPTGNRILVASPQNGLSILSLNPTKAHQIIPYKSTIATASFSPDGSMILVGQLNGTLALLNAETGEVLKQFKSPSQRLISASFSHDGALILTVTGDGIATIRSTATGKVLQRLMASQPITYAAFGPQINFILTAGPSSQTILWRVDHELNVK